MIIEILLIILIFIIFIIGISAFLILKKFYKKIIEFYKKIINFLPSGILSSSAITDVTSPTGELSIKSWKYKFMKLKAYFDNGYSFMSYPKWVGAIFGIGEIVNKNYLVVLFAALIFVFVCLITGWIFIKFGFYEMQQEVSNQFNLFVKEVRERKNI